MQLKIKSTQRSHNTLFDLIYKYHYYQDTYTHYHTS